MNSPDFPLFLFLGLGAISLFSFLAVASWADSRRREREAYYKSETMKKIAETQGGGSTAALEFLREEERKTARRVRDGQKLGGLTTTAVGIGLMIFLRAVARAEPVYLVGFIPLLIGVAMLFHTFFFATKE